uniref:Uncharacterized protein n=1 Tax=viral metagenome TaxID=1070528 RepID=A0A6M3Y0V2_9ZZZZ
MIYTATITTSKNTALAALKHTVLNVTKGLVYKVEFYFPSGSAGLMGLAVFDGLFQLWPSTVGEFFASDDETISFDDMYLKEAAPYQLDIYTYNLDDTYDHQAQARVGLVSQDVYMARWLPTMGYDYFVELLNKMAAEQAKMAAEQAAQLQDTPYEWLVKQLEVSE